ncbi:MAG: DUF3298 domain-containing protein [Prevotella sp.]|nr:DUF3298 domain-containing protein [Prevotella sp.]
MKRNFTCFALLLALLCACGPKEVKNEPTEANTPKQLTDTLVVNLTSRYMSDSTATSALNVAFPVANKKNSTLVAAINEWISEELGGTYGDSIEGDYAKLLSDTAALVDHYFAAIKKLNDDNWKEMAENIQPEDRQGMQLFDSISITKTAEGKDWVTFQFVNEVFQGGAHGSHLVFGQTFRKSDGRRIGWDIIRQLPEGNLQELMRKGLVSYFAADNEEGFKEEDLENVLDESARYYIPMPQCPPLFTSEGILFLYNQYEIAAYAMGLPSFVLTWEELKPYLNVTAKRLTGL